MNKEIAKETTVLVLSGLAINYPLSIIVTWLLISALSVTSPLIFATAQTIIFTVVSWIRIYYIRSKMNSLKQK